MNGIIQLSYSSLTPTYHSSRRTLQQATKQSSLAKKWNYNYFNGFNLNLFIQLGNLHNDGKKQENL